MTGGGNIQRAHMYVSDSAYITRILYEVEIIVRLYVRLYIGEICNYVWELIRMYNRNAGKR